MSLGSLCPGFPTFDPNRRQTLKLGYCRQKFMTHDRNQISGFSTLRVRFSTPQFIVPKPAVTLLLNFVFHVKFKFIRWFQNNNFFSHISTSIRVKLSKTFKLLPSRKFPQQTAWEARASCYRDPNTTQNTHNQCFFSFKCQHKKELQYFDSHLHKIKFAITQNVNDSLFKWHTLWMRGQGCVMWSTA